MPLKYTVCTFFPDLARPQESHDFAVLVASQTDMVLMGCDLSEYALKSEHPLAKAVIENTLGLIESRLQEAEEKSPDNQSYWDILDKVVADNQSNLLFRPFKEIDFEGGIVEGAEQIYKKEIENRLVSAKPRRGPKPAPASEQGGTKNKRSNAPRKGRRARKVTLKHWEPELV